MKKKLPILLLFFLILYCKPLLAQINLGSSGSYVQNFDAIGTGLPTGFTVRTGATNLSIGTTATLTTAATAWSNTTGAFKNFASADALTSTATTTDQAGAADRSLGLRQTGTLGDPSGAFVVQLANTTCGLVLS